MTAEMRDKGGGYYAAQNADTTEGEGTYYTWTPHEVEKVASGGAGEEFCKLFGVTKTGNFEGRNILHLQPGAELEQTVRGRIAKAKSGLYTERLKRPRPTTDTKVLTSWNGLAISALAFAGAVFREQAYQKDAASAAEFVLDSISKDGRLLRRYIDGDAALPGTLEDYAFFVQGLLDLFESASDPKWLGEAVRLTRIMIEEFEDKKDGGFYLSTEPVPARLKESYDGPTPSGNSVAALNLLRLCELTGDTRFRDVAERTLKAFGGELDQRPSAHTTMLSALDLFLNGAREVVITGPSPSSVGDMKAEVYRSFVPDRVVLSATSDSFESLSKLTTLLEGRKPQRKAVAYVCQNFNCKLPADSVEKLREQLSPAKG